MGLFYNTLKDISFRDVAFVVVPTAFAYYRVTLVIYRLYFHPLAKFLGPKITAAILFYEIMWDCFGHGAYLFECERMHKNNGALYVFAT